MIRQGDISQCAYYPYCAEAPLYCLEWWGVNQYGKNPLVVFECYSCASHLLSSALHLDYGGYPDEIQDSETLQPQPYLLAVVSRALDEEWSPQRLEEMLHLVDPRDGQLFLFADLVVALDSHRNV